MLLAISMVRLVSVNVAGVTQVPVIFSPYTAEFVVPKNERNRARRLFPFLSVQEPETPSLDRPAARLFQLSAPPAPGFSFLTAGV